MIKHSPRFTPNEFVIGFIYYILQLLIIPGILVFAYLLLPQYFSAANVNFAYFFVNFVAVLLIFRKFLHRNLQAAIATPWHTLRWAGIGLILYFVGSSLVTGIFSLIAPDFSNINDEAIMSIVREDFRLMTVGIVLLVPIVEETFYRGLFFRTLFIKSPVAAYLVSISAFSLVHIAGYVGMADGKTLLLCFFQYFPAGFALAFSYHHSGNIFPSVLIHMAVNQAGILAMR